MSKSMVDSALPQCIFEVLSGTRKGARTVLLDQGFRVGNDHRCDLLIGDLGNSTGCYGVTRDGGDVVVTALDGRAFERRYPVGTRFDLEGVACRVDVEGDDGGAARAAAAAASFTGADDSLLPPDAREGANAAANDAGEGEGDGAGDGNGGEEAPLPDVIARFEQGLAAPLAAFPPNQRLPRRWGPWALTSGAVFGLAVGIALWTHEPLNAGPAVQQAASELKVAARSWSSWLSRAASAERGVDKVSLLDADLDAASDKSVDKDSSRSARLLAVLEGARQAVQQAGVGHWVGVQPASGADARARFALVIFADSPQQVARVQSQLRRLPRDIGQAPQIVWTRETMAREVDTFLRAQSYRPSGQDTQNDWRNALDGVRVQAVGAGRVRLTGRVDHVADVARLRTAVSQRFPALKGIECTMAQPQDLMDLFAEEIAFPAVLMSAAPVAGAAVLNDVVALTDAAGIARLTQQGDVALIGSVAASAAQSLRARMAQTASTRQLMVALGIDACGDDAAGLAIAPRMIVMAHRPYAVLEDGRVVFEGDRVGRSVVRRIAPDGMTTVPESLRRDGVSFGGTV